MTNAERIAALEKRFLDVDQDRLNRIASLTAALETLTKRVADLEARQQPVSAVGPQNADWYWWQSAGFVPTCGPTTPWCYSDDDILAREIKWGGTD